MRKHALQKTTKPCIYTVKMRDGAINYIVRFSYLGKHYGERNFTKCFGTTTLKETFIKLQEVKALLSRGENPFQKKRAHTLKEYFDEHICTLQGKTQYTLQKYFDKHIFPVIGAMDVGLIEQRHIEKILNGTLSSLADKTRGDLKLILNPLFKRAIREGQRKNNPLEGIKFKKPQPKPELAYRLVSSLEFTAQEIYRSILTIQDEELRAIYLIALMTGRRRGEIMQLKHSDIKDGTVYVPVEITKTRTPDMFPLPEEVLRIIETLPNHGEKIFSSNIARVTRVFSKLILDSDIELIEGSKFTLHDTRHLFQSIMIEKTNNPPLVDRCLSHSQGTSMMNVYLSFSYEKRKSVFQEYWNIFLQE